MNRERHDQSLQETSERVRSGLDLGRDRYESVESRNSDIRGSKTQKVSADMTRIDRQVLARNERQAERSIF